MVDAEVAGAIGRSLGQIVLLGCGYDGRPLRFADGVTRWFEVDRPGALADKRHRLAALGLSAAGTTEVAADLGDGGPAVAAALEASGHDAACPSLFVCESAFRHLALEVTVSLCEAVRERAPNGSSLVASLVVRPEATTAPARTLRRATGALSALTGNTRSDELRPGDPEKLMIVTGWHVIHTEAARRGRCDRVAHQRILVCQPDPTSS